MREELGELILHLEGKDFPDLTEREAAELKRDEWLSKYGWVIGIPFGCFAVWAWLGLFPWLAANLPASFGASGDLAHLFALCLLLGVYGVFVTWLGTRGRAHLDRLSTGQADVRECGLWIERPGEGELVVPWAGVRGYSFKPTEPYVIVVPTAAQEIALHEAFPDQPILSIPTPTEEERAELLRELARREVHDLGRDAEPPTKTRPPR